MLCALIVGTAIGVTTWYTVQLHDDVARLHRQVCAYQLGTERLEDALAAAGLHVRPGHVVPPQDCP